MQPTFCLRHCRLAGCMLDLTCWLPADFWTSAAGTKAQLSHDFLCVSFQDAALSGQLAPLQCAAWSHAQLQRVKSGSLYAPAKEESACRW